MMVPSVGPSSPPSASVGDQRQLQCQWCSYVAPWPSHLKIHVRSHTGQRLFRCRFCPEAFAHLLERQAHERKEHHHGCVDTCPT
ncbi:zinc finger protein 784-like [Haemaphysalis longicornis]